MIVIISWNENILLFGGTDLLLFNTVLQTLFNGRSCFFKYLRVDVEQQGIKTMLGCAMRNATAHGARTDHTNGIYGGRHIIIRHR